MLHAPTLRPGPVHSPKCASVTSADMLEGVATFPRATLSSDLPELASRRCGGGGEHIVRHPRLGDIHLAHLPLQILRDNFPATWALILSGPSFAVVHDPRACFISALIQRLQEFKGYEATDIHPEDLQREAIEVVKRLDTRDAFVDLEHINFMRQSDHVDLDDHRVVTAVFPIERLDALWSRLGETFGLNDQTTAGAGASLAPHGRLRGVDRRLASTYRRVVSEPARQRIFVLSKRGGPLGGVSNAFASLPFGEDVERFIRTFYAKDMEIHRAALAEWGP